MISAANSRLAFTNCSGCVVAADDAFPECLIFDAAIGLFVLIFQWAYGQVFRGLSATGRPHHSGARA